MYQKTERTALEILEESDRPFKVYDIGVFPYGGDMRFPEVGRQCVIYIGKRSVNGTFEQKGTGFVIEVIRGKRPRYYLVTAHHVIRRLLNPAQFAIRLNATEDGRARELQSKGKHRWWRHPDRSVDAAVYPWTQGTSKFQFSAFSSERCVVPGGDQGVGVGDEVNVVGLFRHLAGAERINPMVRTGHIAMMAEERFDSHGYYGKALFHWIESFTIKGFSGSPVFARQTVGIKLPDPKNDGATFLRGAGDLYLLGVLHGMMPLEVHEELTGFKDKTQRWHSGIAMVVPAHQILEILEQPELIDYEASVFDKDKTKSGTDEETSIERSEPAPKKKRGNHDIMPPPISRGKFFDALDKATKRDKK